MKRLTAIFTGVLLAGVLSLAQAQAPFARYKTTVTTGDEYHTLSNAATILWEPTATDTLNRRLLTGSKQILVKNGSKYPITFGSGSLISIFGTEKFYSAGIFADGFVFFGSQLNEGDQTDSIRPFIDENFFQMGEAKNYLYSSFADGASKGAVLLGGENVKIGYETVDDVLYIAYENIRVKTSEQNVATLSWYYTLNSATGEITLHTKDFALSGNTEFQYSFGMVASGDFTNNDVDALWLASWGGETSTTFYRQIPLSSTSNPKDSVYHFNLPEACGKIADFQMTAWGEPIVESEQITIGGMPSWNEGTKALFILSEEATLSGDNLPQDGVLYNDNSKIGSSAGVRIGERMMGCFLNNPIIDGLKPGTTYYLHAFGYNDTCSGIQYSDVQTKTTGITTAMGSPAGVALKNIQMESLQVVLPEPESGKTYVVGVSENSLAGFSEILANGETYTAGQEIPDNFGMYEVTLKQVGANAGSYTIDGLKEGTNYYIAVWYMTGSGENTEYSFYPAVVATKTVMQVPAQIDFEEEEEGIQPIGWKISQDGDLYGFEVRTYGEAEDGGIDDGGIALNSKAPMAKAPQSGSKLLVSQLNYLPEDHAAAPQKKDTSAYAITPLFQKAANPNVTAIFNVGFYTKENDMSSETAYRLQDGDSAVISWAASQEATSWTKLAKLDKNTKFDNNGFITLTTSSIAPESTFCYKVEFFFKADKDATAGVMFAIQNLEVEEDLPCKYPVNMAAPEDELGATSALLTWEDGNAGVSEFFAQSFIISYQEQGQTDWVKVSPNPTDEQCRLENLHPGMDYTVRMQAVCGSQNGNSLVKTMEFRTLDVIPYTVDILNGDDVTELVNANGALNTEPEPIDEDGWLYTSDCAGYPIMNLQLAVNRNAWLKLPTLVSSYDTKVKVSTSVFNYKNQFGTWSSPEVKDDTLWVFVSETGKFATASDRKTVGFIVLDSLDFELKDDGDMVFIPKYNEKVFEFDAQAGKKYKVAYYIRSIHAGASDNEEEMNVNNLAIGKISLTYGDVDYPAVTDLHTENLAKTSVSVVWTGNNADSYVVRYKPRREENFDSVKVTASRANLTDLLPGTSYEYSVYGIYGGVHGSKSETQYFNTIAICEAPTDFAVVDTFWDGARIVARSKNPRLIHIEALGEEIGEFWVNTVMSWTGTRDSVRLRGLHVMGVGFPFGVRVRSVCSAGDSSEWTPRLVFHTADYPEIGLPTNLKAQYNSDTRTAVLSWTPGVNNDYNYIYYRKGTGKYDTTVTKASTYTLVGLETDVVYKWRLQPLYDSYLLGDMTPEQEINTAVGNEKNTYAQSLRIRVNNRQIVVENPDSRYIKLIRVYDLKGRVLKTYPVNDTESVFVNTDLDQGMVIVEVIGSAGERASLKAVIM